MSVFDQYAVMGDEASDGNSVFLYCRRCPEKNRPEHMADVPSLGTVVGRFLTDHWADKPEIATLQTLWDAARAHDAEFHDGFKKEGS
jgi:cytochrome c2